MPRARMPRPGIATQMPSTRPLAMVATPRPMAKGHTLAWGRYSSWAPVGLVVLGRRHRLGRVARALLQPQVGAAPQGEDGGQGDHRGAGLLVGGRGVDGGDDGEPAADHQEQPQGHGPVVDPPAALVAAGPSIAPPWSGSLAASVGPESVPEVADVPGSAAEPAEPAEPS